MRLVYLVVLVTSACTDASRAEADAGTPYRSADAPGDAPEAGPHTADASANGDAESGADASPDDADAQDARTDAFCPDAGDAFPQFLSETGLYASGTVDTLAPGVGEYEPAASLWADGATKRRFVRLPAGVRVDTHDMDAWRYPAGTTLWKEFALGGRRLETRLLQKRSERDGDWLMMAYRWNAGGTEAEAVPEGATDVGGTDHDVPSAAECGRCHGGLVDAVLGFTAVQLSGARASLSLTELVSGGKLTHPPTTPVVIPGNETERTALAYLHANCGHCHNRNTVIGQRTGYAFWLDVATLGAVETTRSFQTATADLMRAPSPEHAGILGHMTIRGPGQMPPLATERVDQEGSQVVRAWLASLGERPDGGQARD